MNQNYEALLAFTRNGIGHSASFPQGQIDWELVQDLASSQGVSALVLDGIEILPDNKRPPKEVLLQWIGNTLQSYEYRFELYRRAIAEMAEWYNSYGFKMMVMKGYACALDWQKPEHRPCGDIDIWLFGQQKEADEVLSKDKGIAIDNSHQHHTVFTWRDFSVENHYDFINIHHHKTNASFEKILKELGEDDSHFVDVYGEKVYLPSANLHALFLLKHNMMHFAAEGLTLRHLLDWAFFAKAHYKEVKWDWLMGVLEQYGMKELFNAFNAICVEDLGFEPKIFHQVQFNPGIKDRILKDILDPEYSASLPKGLLHRISYKFKRWKGNAWKHKLCYKENMWSAFWTGVWNHLLKPSSI